MGTLRQRVARLRLIETDHAHDLAPVHRRSVHRPAHDVRVAHHGHNGLHDTRIHRVLVDLLGGKTPTVHKAVAGVELTGLRIQTVVLAKPILQNIHFHISIFLFDTLLETNWQRRHFYQGIIAKTFTSAHHVDLTALLQLLIIGFTHNGGKHRLREIKRGMTVQHTASAVVCLAVHPLRPVVVGQVLGRNTQYLAVILHSPCSVCCDTVAALRSPVPFVLPLPARPHIREPSAPCHGVSPHRQHIAPSRRSSCETQS